jgi:hypothetical protein
LIEYACIGVTGSDPAEETIIRGIHPGFGPHWLILLHLGDTRSLQQVAHILPWGSRPWPR